MARILIVSPHGDDEVLGCGGMIARATDNGNEVTILYGGVGGLQHRHLEQAATFDERIVEIGNACLVLGVQHWQILFPELDMRLDTLPQLDIVSKLDRLLDEGYDHVYIPYPSHNSDHQALHRACMAALRPGAHNGISLIALYEYVYPGWCQYTEQGGRLYVDISNHLERKLEALSCYRSQLRNGNSPCSPTGVRALAAIRGLEASVQYAELFHLLQLVR
jgi:LmbE family N-acetylglucosaminyl deacetylase